MLRRHKRTRRKVRAIHMARRYKSFCHSYKNRLKNWLMQERIKSIFAPKQSKIMSKRFYLLAQLRKKITLAAVYQTFLRCKGIPAGLPGDLFIDLPRVVRRRHKYRLRRQQKFIRNKNYIYCITSRFLSLGFIVAKIFSRRVSRLKMEAGIPNILRNISRSYHAVRRRAKHFSRLIREEKICRLRQNRLHIKIPKRLKRVTYGFKPNKDNKKRYPSHIPIFMEFITKKKRTLEKFKMVRAFQRYCKRQASKREFRPKSLLNRYTSRLTKYRALSSNEVQELKFFIIGERKLPGGFSLESLPIYAKIMSFLNHEIYRRVLRPTYENREMYFPTRYPYIPRIFRKINLRRRRFKLFLSPYRWGKKKNNPKKNQQNRPNLRYPQKQQNFQPEAKNSRFRNRVWKLLPKNSKYRQFNQKYIPNLKSTQPQLNPKYPGEKKIFFGNHP